MGNTTETEVLMAPPGAPPPPPITSIVYPDGRTIKPEDDPEIIGKADVVVKPKGRSIIRSNPKAIAGHIEIEGYYYYYKAMPDPLQDWVKAKFSWIAKQLGISDAEFANDDYRKVKPASKLDPLLGWMTETFDVVLVACLTDWDDPDVPVTDANKTNMDLEPKARIFSAIKISSEAGQNLDSFRLQAVLRAAQGR